MEKRQTAHPKLHREEVLSGQGREGVHAEPRSDPREQTHAMRLEREKPVQAREMARLAFEVSLPWRLRCANFFLDKALDSHYSCIKEMIHESNIDS